MTEFTDLTPEQLEKLRKITKIEELVALAKEEGLELTDEELEAISGGKGLSGCVICGLLAPPHITANDCTTS